MSSDCDRLYAFADGELDDEGAAAFRAHLIECEACAAKLPEVLEIITAFEGARHPRVRRAAVRVVPGGAPAEARRSFRWWRVLAAMIAIAAAGVVITVIAWSRRNAPPASPFARLPAVRTIPFRFAYDDPNVAKHREYSVERGPGEPEGIPLAASAELERRGDWHGLGIAMLLSGNPGQAGRHLDKLPPSPAVDVDRAVVALVERSDQGLDLALRLLERALAADPDSTAARWNRGLALERLGLPLTAAGEMETVAARNEPGWGAEARERAGRLEADAGERRKAWERANALGRELVEGKEVGWDELAGLPRGITRYYLYEAIRAAESRAAVERLLPIAERLDAAAGPLARLARSVLDRDFAVRAPLAREYRAIVLEVRTLQAAELDALAGRARSAGAIDVWMGLIGRHRAIGRYLAEYRKAAAATGDPWFEALAEQEVARQEAGEGNRLAAEQRLLAASERAGRSGMTYRKLLIDVDLANLYRGMGRYPDAEALALRTQREAEVAGEWNIETDALNVLAETTRFRYSFPRARAYLREVLARELLGGDDADRVCLWKRQVHQSLASVAMLGLDAATARRELAAAPSCDRPITTLAASTAADLYRFGGNEKEAARLREQLAELRSTGTLDEATQAFVDEVEGRLVVEIDRAAGRALLRSAIDRAGALADGGRPVSDAARKARAFSFSVLALDSGRAGEWGEVFGILAEELRTEAPDRCAVGVAVEDERSIVVIRDAAGTPAGTYSNRHTTPDVDAAALVPRDLVERLSGCEQVSVLARPPVLGMARLLPPGMAWAYRVGGAPEAGTGRAGRRLIIADAQPPATSKLPPLAPFVDEGTGAQVLRGPAATPRGVLAAMREASMIEFHVHGFIDRGLSDASYLALSPDEKGWYALTAADLAGTRLEGSPVVILAACHAGRSAPFLDDARGLPLGFIRAGAVAVVAGPVAMDDRAAARFFRAVRAKLDAGVTPAVAVRDARDEQSPWTAEIVVYE